MDVEDLNSGNMLFYGIHYLDGSTEQRILSTGKELRAALEDVFLLKMSAIAGLDRALQQLAEANSLIQRL